MIKMFHHLLPFLLFPAMLYVVFIALFGKISNPKKNFLLTTVMILAHTQLVLGLLLYIDFIKGGIHMEVAENRYFSAEHPFLMLIGVLLITLGKMKAKRMDDILRANKIIFWYFLVALVLIAIRTPWERLF